MHTVNQNKDISLAKEFQQHLTEEHFAKMVSLIRANTKNVHGNNMERQTVSCSGHC